MTKIKILISLAVCVILFSLLFNVSASPLFSASLILNTNTDKSNTVYVNVNESVQVSLFINTSKGYFAGPFSTPVFYTGSMFEAEPPKLNTSGRFYNCCKSYTSAVTSEKLDPQALESLYPAGWSAQQTKENKLIYTVMVPNSQDCKKTPDALNEALWTANLKVNGPVNSKGSIFIPQECVRSADNIDGPTYLACYSDGGDILSKRYDYGNDMKIDVSQAKISYQVTDKADVDNDNAITSGDALLILQHSVELKKLDSKAFSRADITKDGKLASDDALAVLNIATGVTTINKYMH